MARMKVPSVAAAFDEQAGEVHLPNLYRIEHLLIDFPNI